MFQTIEVSVRDTIVREEIVAVLVGIESLDAHRPKFTSWHTPGDVIASIDDNNCLYIVLILHLLL